MAVNSALGIQVLYAHESPVADRIYLGGAWFNHTSPTSEVESLKLFPRSREFFSLTTKSAHRIILGLSRRDRLGKQLFSMAVATDPLRSKLRALTFPDSLYDPDAIMARILERTRQVLAPRESIIPFQHDSHFQFDDYSEFLKEFQWGVPVVEVMRASQQLINPHGAPPLNASERERSLRGRIAWVLLECCRETLEATGSLLGAVSALDFIRRMREGGITDEISVRVASQIGKGEGFARYVSRVARQYAGQKIDATLPSTTTQTEVTRQWNSGLLDPIFVA